MIEFVTAGIAALLLFYLFFLTGILKGLNSLIGESFKTRGNSLPEDYISIIIPFRNESKKILKSLESIEKQDYPRDKFEVIYVNDFSDDDSLEILGKAEKAKNIKILSVPEEYSKYQHKKRAIRFGIENSHGSIIVTTDADCLHGVNWLRTLIGQFDSETGFVSGPVEFLEESTLFNRMQRLEFAGLVLTGAGLIGINEPIICNAANIAYRKKAFNEVSGFSYKHSLASGDDELLMQKIRKETNYKIKFCMDKGAVVKTSSNGSLNQFYQQRKRWASKGLFYSNHLLILKLIMIFLFYLSFPVQLILGIFYDPIFLFWMLVCFVIKAMMEYMILRTGSNILFNKSILKPFIPAEILHIPYILIAGISGSLGNYIWKERKIKR
ncbi:MAG: glycosyltransferase [Ignavibacteriaceae bacterium]|nr:glycosyltransferase [Ignavibacteriaceae bacterium]